MTATEEAPVSAGISIPDAFTTALESHNGSNGMPIPNAPEAQPIKETPEKAPEIAQEAPKPETSKNPWDNLDALKTNPEGKEKPSKESPEKAVDPQKEEIEGSPQKIRWNELRKKEERLEKEVLPEMEKLQSRIKELETKPQIPEETQQRLDFLEKKYAVDNLVNNTDYQREVLQPWQEADQEIDASAKHAGLEPAQVAALHQAIQDKDAFSRNKSIRSIMQQGKVDDDADLHALITNVSSVANTLHKQVWPKDAQYRAQASEIANAAKGHDVQISEQQKAAKEAEYTKAHAEISNILNPRLETLFKDNKEAQEAIKSARPATDPMGSAYQAQAGEILPFLTKDYNRVLAENAELKRLQGVKNSVKPKDGDGREHRTEPEQKLDLTDALSAHFRGGY